MRESPLRQCSHKGAAATLAHQAKLVCRSRAIPISQSSATFAIKTQVAGHGKFRRRMLQIFCFTVKTGAWRLDAGLAGMLFPVITSWQANMTAKLRFRALDKGTAWAYANVALAAWRRVARISTPSSITISQTPNWKTFLLLGECLKERGVQALGRGSAE